MLKFGAGFVAGFVALFVLILIFGDYEETPPVANAQPLAQVNTATMTVQESAPTTIPIEGGPAYKEVCKPDTNNMTDPQIAAHAKKYEGRRISGWRGWVYDVTARADGTYNLEIAMEERGLFWSRNVVVENIVSDLAERLNVEQPVTLSGRIASVETSFEVMCNPIYIDEYVLVE